MTTSAKRLTAALLLAAWIGAALITVAVVAPGAFAVLPSRTMAGQMVGAVLPAVFLSGIVIGLVTVALMGLARDRFVPAITALCSVAACSVAQFLINPKIARLRDEIHGPVDALSPDDVRRVAFGLLHGYSVAGLGVAMLASTLSLAFILYSPRPTS